MLRFRWFIACALLLDSCAPLQDPGALPRDPVPRGAELLRGDLPRGDVSRVRVDPDYRQSGSLQVTVTRGELKFATGRALAYSRFQPGRRERNALVILGHGFMRDQARMAGLARHLASWGVDVATLDFRHSRLWAGHHDKNAEDMQALARHLQAKRVIYAGFSAGGLSGLLAAASDPAAIGYLGLDPVDDGTGAGARAAAKLPFGPWVLLGAPSSCNAHGNARQLIAAAKIPARVLLVPDASHCDFEFPRDQLCALVCGHGGERRRSRKEVQDEILGLATVSILSQEGVR